MSGLGTTLAFVGPYILAGEIAKRPGELNLALVEYERLMRPLITQAQKLPPGVPWIATPESGWGNAVFRSVLSVAASIAKTGIGQKFGGGGSVADKFDLPDYEDDVAVDNGV